jgi:hypothetical protein
MKTVRIITFLVGLLTLVWQGMQVANGKAQNMFFIADIFLGAFLIASAILKPIEKNISWLMVALAYASGVFSTATFGGLTMGTYNFGAFTTTLGLIPCLGSIVWLISQKK